MQTQTLRASINRDPFQSSHSRWLALIHRAPSSHSSFVYGVKSTKIYCRPTCNARPARRANIVFYDTKDQAQRDGYRPCKRCQPDNASFVGKRDELVTRVMALLWTKKDGGLMMKRGLKELATEVGVTPSYLCRVFKKTMGVTVGEYIKEFERETGEGEIESEVQSLSPSEYGSSSVVDVATESLTTAIIPSGLLVPPEVLLGELVEVDMGSIEEDLDCSVNFGDWVWTDDFLNEGFLDGGFLDDSIYELTWHDSRT
ncbi:hypothetical protein L228DRAFT_249315 [Xylona heveae TC161]|uniref:HTH araC/xylS-type domain-containing protein n=1 Tax=Xylona heveae (strain CBS 132557 / TC161) TaxID=1328760 RepID=A0A165AIW9_XYLHT|nr:hypothetical protein L228DRAFT_249315 [Xylona heveae TC161]KZF20557.1 hypothetical protein L228DRAFT_249315 [Xylona heveae TC161]